MTTTLKFIGRADYYVAGYPKTDLVVVATPSQPNEITQATADILLATDVYVLDPAIAQLPVNGHVSSLVVDGLPGGMVVDAAGRMAVKSLTVVPPSSISPYTPTAIPGGIVAGSLSTIAGTATYPALATSIGNVGTFPFAGTGSPAEMWEPLVIFQKFGLASPGSNVLKTTQAFSATASYYGPTTDDSAQGGSSQGILADTGTPFTQALPLVGMEGDAIVQGGNILTNKAVGVVGAAYGQNTAQITNAMAFYVAAKAADAAGVTITNWYGFYQETPNVVGTVTNKWGAYFRDDVQIDSQGNQGRLIVGASGVQANSARVLFVGPNVTGGATEVPTLIVQQGAGQVSGTVVLRNSSALTRLQLFAATGNVLIGNGPTGGSGVGIVSMVTTTAPTGVPVANGSWFYVDPADGDMKTLTRNSDGSAGVTRRLAPSHWQLLMEGLGFKSWAFDPNLGSGSTAPTQGTVYVRALPLRAGQVLANVVFEVVTAATGANPTGMFAGIADSTGKMLAQSNNLNASGIWFASGMAQAPLSASYTVLADGLYYAVFLQVGAYGATQPTFQKGVNNSAPAGLGTTIFGTGGTTGQTALPATGSSIAGGIVTTNGIDYFAGAN